MVGKYDITLKDMFSDLTDDILSYFLGIQHIKIEELNVEFPRVEMRESDMIFKCITKEGNTIAVHLEFQSDNDKEMPYRMLRYAVEIMEKHELVPYQVVVYIGENNLNMADGVDFDFGKENFLRYRYRIIDVGEVKFNEITQTNYYELFTLLPLMDKERRKKEKELYLKECAEMIKKIPLEQERKREVTARAKILAELVYEEEIIDKMFVEVIKMLNLEKSVTFRKLIEEGRKEGEKEGKLAVAKELLKRGMNIDEIAEITKLSKEEIKKLLN
ncbi:Rpn family recombination-promoting nuclease/putative transposase [Thermoanaerobacter sp. YS13]|uniref:Rpn family recombination-promoting nuclease/putative transposase n=1 Tax=Thermoanaerobacter sp. YS13 TaxID=1511746 RepID=UPI0012900662|nr:Rpn family recombination-promoting nuclease/putative transposase [Thermoanaerobacter sp. YS13]